MSPSPRIKATINEAVYRLVCEQLQLDPIPTLAIRTTGRSIQGKQVYGDYNSITNHVRLFLDVTNYEFDQLRFATTELIRTLLHELRHAHQAQHNLEIWNAKNDGPREIDAESWACDNVSRYFGLARLSRTFPNSGFSRLSRHTSRRVV